MEQPMFYQGQRVVCINTFKCATSSSKVNPLIEGKSYIISNNDSKHHLSKGVTVQIAGFPQGQGGYHFNQNQFVPYDTDCQLEEQIFEAMKGVKINS